MLMVIPQIVTTAGVIQNLIDIGFEVVVISRLYKKWTALELICH